MKKSYQVALWAIEAPGLFKALLILGTKSQVILVCDALFLFCYTKEQEQSLANK